MLALYKIIEEILQVCVQLLLLWAFKDIFTSVWVSDKSFEVCHLSFNNTGKPKGRRGAVSHEGQEDP